MPEPIHHHVEYTKNRHSRALLRNGEIVIRLARNLNHTEEKEHIAHLLRRMAKVVVRENECKHIDPFRPLLEGASETLLPFSSGEATLFLLQAGTRNRIRRTPQGWTITVGPSMRKRRLHALLWKVLSQDRKSTTEMLVHAVNIATLGVRVSSVRLKFMSSQWGSCSPHGVITLNTALLFLPSEVLTYVVIHELAHRLHPDHSRKFWQTVERACPSYKNHRALLRSFRLHQL